MKLAILIAVCSGLSVTAGKQPSHSIEFWENDDGNARRQRLIEWAQQLPPNGSVPLRESIRNNVFPEAIVRPGQEYKPFLQENGLSGAEIVISWGINRLGYSVLRLSNAKLLICLTVVDLLSGKEIIHHCSVIDNAEPNKIRAALIPYPWDWSSDRKPEKK